MTQLISPTTPHYRVGKDIYYSKVEALVAATATNIHPTWHWADHVWKQVDWTHDYNHDLRELYKKRARQLRESYDYLVLSYSGGSDSRTVLDAFLSQGLHIDEILHSWPIKGTENRYDREPDPNNFLCEWDFVARPDLELISQKWPNIKITINDFSDGMLGDDVIEEDHWLRQDDFLCPNVTKKYGFITEGEQKALDSGKKTALIMGLEKPEIVYKDGKLFTFFLDKYFGLMRKDTVSFRKTEMFFWTPDMPEMVQQRARSVYRYFVTNPQHLYLIDWETRRTNKTRPNKQRLNNIIRSVIYPDWDPQRFQAYKPSDPVWQENDQWFFDNHKHTRFYQSWIWGVEHLQKSVHPKYQEFSPDDGRWIGWVGFFNDFFYLGDIDLAAR